MNRSLILLFLLLLIVSLQAEVFLPNYYLEGVQPIQENKIDVYKVPAGVSINRTTPFLLFKDNLKTEFEVDYDEPYGTYRFLFNRKIIPIFPPIYRSVQEYHDAAYYVSLRTLLFAKTQSALTEETRADGSGLIKDIVINLPDAAVPKMVRRIMGGSEAARLSLNGSQRLTIGYHSTSSSKPGTELNDYNNKDFNIRQDLNLNLRGTIGQKIHVDVTHNTSATDDIFASPSVVKIWYEGLEDEVIQRIEGGDIAFQLSGSKFFGSAASSQGLFGVKTELQAGNLKVTTIIGKEESKKDVQTFTPGQDRTSTTKYSSAYEKDTYFYTVHPDSLFVLYDENIDGELPLGWHQNAIKQEDGQILLQELGYDATPHKDSTMYVYIDTGVITGDDIVPIDGVNIDSSDTNEYSFQRINDFHYYNDIGMLKINQTIGDTYSIGIAYYDRNNNFIGDVNPTEGDPIRVKIIRKREQNEDTDTWKYTARNRYYLGATNIQSEGFSLNIFEKNNDNSDNYDVTGEIANNYPGIKTYIDYLQLDSNQDGVVDGDDTFVDLISGTLRFPFIEPFRELEKIEGDEAHDIYGAGNVNTSKVKTLIEIDGQLSSDQINLNALNILPGSVSIKVDGAELQENIDYMVDYDFGTIVLLSDRARLKTSELQVRYEYKPLFALDNRTLIGMRADLDVNENLKFGSTFVYQSEKVQDDRPKIGSENRSMIMADFDTRLTFDPPFLTKMVDFLPLIKTDVDSEVSLTAEVAMSLPRIWGNKELGDRKQAYVEDMESILESFSLGISRPVWSPASQPINTDSSFDIENFVQAKMYWFNDDKYRQKDLYDNLQDKEGNEKANVLACIIPEMGEENTTNWQGIMRYLGAQMDISEKNYIQLLTKVAPNDNDGPVVMYIDIGPNINEDFYPPWDPIDNPDGPGNGDLDTEDEDSNGRLDPGEDTGLDGVEGEDGKNVEGDDGDDDFSNTKVNGEYPYINGTEGNGKLDTEDLNRNGLLNSSNNYAEYRIELSELSPYYVSSSGEKDWQLFRIPIHEYEQAIDASGVDEVNLSRVNYARVWFEVTDSVRVDIAEMDVVGNKWKKTAIRDEADGVVEPTDNNDFSIGVVDNQRNPHYVSPPNTTIKKNDEELLEQSLMIKYDNLEQGNNASAYQLVRDPSSSSYNQGMNLLSYNEMRFWVYAEYPENEIGNENDKLIDVIYRIGADSLNYYEVREPVTIRNYNAASGSNNGVPAMDKSHWKEVTFTFSEITSLKVAENVADTTRFRVVGLPTLTNVKYLSVGIDAIHEFKGQLYVNEIRVADPVEDIGFAARSSFHTSFADFSDISVNLEWQSPNFQNRTDRNIQATREENTSLNITNSYKLQKFFPAEWGFNIPFTLKRLYSQSTPTYGANSDILREDLSEEDKERNKSTSLTEKIELNFSQSKTPRNKILAYTIKNTSINSSVERKEILRPTSADTTITYYLTHQYDLPIPKDKVGLRLLKDYHFYFIPNTFSNRLEYNQTEPRKWNWRSYADSSYWEPAAQTTPTKNLKTKTNVRYDIFTDLYTTYDLNTERDLLLEGEWNDIPIGQEKKRNQSIFIKHSPKYYDRLFTITTDIDFKYTEERKKTTTADSLKYIGNNTRRENISVKLKNSDLLQSFASKLAPKKNTNQEDDDKENEDNKDEPISGEPEIEESENERETEEQEENEREENGEEELPNKDEPDKPAVAPSGKRVLASVFSFLARLQNFDMSYTNSYGSGYDYRNDRPDFLYQLGFGGSLTEEDLTGRQYGDKFNISSGFLITENLNSTFSFSKEINKNYRSGNNTQTINTNYPNLMLTLNRFETIVAKFTKLDSLLESSRLESRFNYILNESGTVNWAEPDRVKKSYSLEPLLLWNANWVYAVTTRLSYSHFTSSEKTFFQGEVERTELRQTVSGSISYSFTAPSGLKIPFIGSKIRFDNKLTTEMNMSYSRNLNETITATKTDITLEKYTLNISPTANYQFNENITGGLTGKYEITDKKQDLETLKIFDLSMWVEIKF